eukprot:TRINITY_DN11069_c0_g1_i2.p1 TRINITY_DN11069_c0_g1~~TRINITY_DN11069_c0_g1_i2.p1  ORF type:complete len:190 (+),score=53.89 TRINITY_DN11069_c0_g1_i2:80-649(+)
MSKNEKTVLVPISDGTEEIEAVTIIDTLRRAGANVTVASTTSEKQVTCSRKTKLVADVLIEDCVEKTYDLIAVPGGMPGAKHLSESAALKKLLDAQQKSDRVLSAICAAPAVVLGHHGLLKHVKATSYPNDDFKDKIPEWVDSRVVVDKKVVTSQGPGTSLEFALTLVGILYGEKTKSTIQKQMLVPEF